MVWQGIPLLEGNKGQDTIQETISETTFQYSADNNCPNSSSLIGNKIEDCLLPNWPYGMVLGLM